MGTAPITVSFPGQMRWGIFSDIFGTFFLTITAITQNVEYLLDSVLASTMLSNSEYIVMLNQAASDRQKLADLLNISSEQMSYITNADAGCGLIKYGSSLVPFINKFPKNTRLYKLMTTKPGEDSADRNR